MKPTTFLRYASFALSLSFLSGFSSAQLVLNPSFEQSQSGKLVGWKLDQGRSNYVEIPADGSSIDSAEGTSVFLEEETVSGESGVSHALTFIGAQQTHRVVHSDPFPLVPGYNYGLTVVYRAEGLVAESLDKNYSALNVDLYMERDAAPRFMGMARVKGINDSAGWSSVNRLTPYRGSNSILIPDGTEYGVLRPALVNRTSSSATVWIDSIDLTPLDLTLRNGGFEKGETEPEAWVPFGGAEMAWTDEHSHGGQHAVSVSNAGEGLFSGWSTRIPVRADRAYTFSGYIKGGDLNANGFISGGALSIQFLDRDGQAIGEPTLSPAVGGRTDWTEVRTDSVTPPVGAVLARLVAGMTYCIGTAWYDDLSVETEVVVAKDAKLLERPNPQPTQRVRYAENLLKNGEVEVGQGDQPEGWTYHGRSEPDWTESEVKTYHEVGRPKFNVGRGIGKWSRGRSYAGSGALLNESIDPPLFMGNQWHAYAPVDGYWLSDSMPCEPGKPYVASAWMKVGRTIGIGAAMWLGPLEIRFYNNNGKQLQPVHSMRSGMSALEAGVWTYYATLPYVAPEGATQMRLRFGHEFHANRGGQGRTLADNLAVWQLPEEASLPDYKTIPNNTEAYRDWFREATQTLKPPYLSSPSSFPSYESVWAKVQNTQIGNLFYDSEADVALQLTLTNVLGESRELTFEGVRYDAWGNEDADFKSQKLSLKGASTDTYSIQLPPTHAYGAWYIDGTILEQDVPVGHVNGRYAVLPELNPENEPNHSAFAVTNLVPIMNDGRPFEKELGEMLRIAGFGTTWERVRYQPNEASIHKSMEELEPILDWYRQYGINAVVTIRPELIRPVDPKVYEAAGRVVGRTLNGKVAALGNWGIEQANSASPYRGGGADRWTDFEFDTIMAAQYDGIKEVAPELTVLTGNIATDFEAKTIRRHYEAPGNGKFDGSIMNAYMSAYGVAENAIKEFDRHGDTWKTVWWEETAEQRSPFEGDARRYGEISGPKQMVRTWLTMLGKLYPRLQNVTMWGFVRKIEQDIVMVTPSLQPRPHYVAHAVMADKLRTFTAVTDRSTEDGRSIFDWAVSRGTLLTAWMHSGEGSLTLEVPSGSLVVTDIMGNSQQRQAVDGVVTVELSAYPVYIESLGSLQISQRISAGLTHASTELGQRMLQLDLKNNAASSVHGDIIWSENFVDTEPTTFDLAAGESIQIQRQAQPDLPTNERSPFSCTIQTSTGGTYGATAALNFAQAVHAPSKPNLDGTWIGWEEAPAITFGLVPEEVVAVRLPKDVSYRGAGDIFGTLRMMWDDEYLYLGIESTDDHFVTVPERNRTGFMGDSIEFGIQPDGQTATEAPYWEYEVYQPSKTPGRYMASRRRPLPVADMEEWDAVIQPTGENGNAVLQIALPWSDAGVSRVEPGKVFSMALVLNDADRPDRFSGERKRVRWFQGVDKEKNPSAFGDVVLVNSIQD
jgi:hypothetical protein